MTALQTPPSDDRLAELHALAAASLSGEPSDEEIARLERLVCEDQELCKLYVRYMYVLLESAELGEGSARRARCRKRNAE